VANAFNNCLLNITENLNVDQVEKVGAISLLKGPLSGNFSSLKMLTITEA
jgi:hypothetical protein